MRLLLVNPNTSAGTTAAMLAIAREAAPPGVLIEAATAPFGEPLITDETALAIAAEAVEALVTGERVAGLDGVIVAAFGDPGLALLKARLPVPPRASPRPA
jgi:Asp/Glu/hydantoin racemase